MKKIEACELSAYEIHESLIAAGFINLVCIGASEHWVRDERRITVIHSADVSSLPIEKLEVRKVFFAHFAQLKSGEVVVL